MAETLSIPSDEFLFIGEHPVLDFINTEIAVRGKPQDLLATPTALGQWWQTAHRYYPELTMDDLPVPDEETLKRGKEFRTMLRRLITGWIQTGTLDRSELQTLNTILSESSPALHQHENGTPETRFLPRPNAPRAPFLPLAVKALHLLTTVERDRVHECHNDRCVLLFLDTTRSKTRQWCSLACLERERSRHRYHTRQGK